MSSSSWYTSYGQTDTHYTSVPGTVAPPINTGSSKKRISDKPVLKGKEPGFFKSIALLVIENIAAGLQCFVQSEPEKIGGGYDFNDFRRRRKAAEDFVCFVLWFTATVMVATILYLFFSGLWPLHYALTH